MQASGWCCWFGWLLWQQTLRTLRCCSHSEVQMLYCCLVVVAAAVVEEAMVLKVVMTLAVVDVVVLPDVLNLLEDAVIAVIVKKDRSFQAHSGREHSTHCKLRKRMQIEKNKRKLRKIHQGCFKGTQRSDEPDCSSMLCEVQSPLTSSRLQ